MKRILTLLSVLVLAGVVVSCGKSGGSGNAQMPEQPEAQAALFQRTVDRVKTLIEAKDFKQAQDTLGVFKSYKLTPEQQKVVDQLQAQIPKTN